MDYLYLFNLICQRRLVTLSKVANYQLLCRVNFGVADGTSIVPAVADAFYFFPTFQILTFNTIGGTPAIKLSPNSGQVSGGDIEQGATVQRLIENLEVDSITYVLNSHASGSFYCQGSGFKITYV